MNSIKMKIAVIFGVWQMSLGIILRGCNNAYHRQWVDFFFEFVPQIIILLCLFGYMDMLIVIKWLTNWEGRTATAPSVISTMVDMFLNGGNPTNPSDDPIIGTWQEQTKIEVTLIEIVLVCIPLMLFVKPIFLACTKPKSHGEHSEQADILDKAAIDACGKLPMLKCDSQVAPAPRKESSAKMVDDDDNF